MRIVIDAFELAEPENKEEVCEPIAELVDDAENSSLNKLFVQLSKMCAKAPKPVVLMIDEIDSASNNQVFIDFLAQLRGYYLKRNRVSTFHSVILAGVYDIKNMMNLFMAKEAITSDVFSQGETDRIQFIKNNRLDMDLVLKKFVEYFSEIYGEKDYKW